MGYIPNRLETGINGLMDNNNFNISSSYRKRDFLGDKGT